LPESRQKYLYERLGDHNFQLLVDALLTQRYSDYFPLPLRQSDGGRDGVRRSGKGLLTYQVKWSVNGREKDPVSWLTKAVKGEDANIRARVADGATKYFLVTNVPSTGKPGTGTFDKLQTKLDELGKEYGIEMACLWREAIDAMVDPSDDIKWTYADMLAGWDLIRYLIDEHFQSKRDGGLRELVRKVAAAQWDEDERVKFSQVDVDRERVADLFVDVTAERIWAPERATEFLPTSADLGGAASYLLRASVPFTLVRGAPGQGKSTLSQYVCQAHRAAFIPESERPANLPTVTEPRFPLRFDLGEYAVWLRGVDVFDPSDAAGRAGKARPSTQGTIECFVADLMTHAAGGRPVAPADVHNLLERVPTLVVLDGLDEVGSTTARTKVVKEIDHFCSRARSYTVPPRVVVTTRPSAGELPEPSLDHFEVISLNPLDSGQRDEYLRKWCLVRNIRGRDGRTLRTTFRQKSAEPYIGELAGNPMQLTILLELLNKQGLAAPTQRTELYDDYMELLLAREANKHPDSVRKHRDELVEIVPFLGWYLQSRSEEHGLGGRMGTDDLEAAMRHFQKAYSRPENIVDELFEATTDRLWALTSKEQGIYEFEVVSLREYFAAQFLYRFAGEGERNFDRATVFRELLGRPYWLNTARFYGGNARGSDIYTLSAAIRDEMGTRPAKPAHMAAWTLLTDGVFASRPTEGSVVVEALCSDAGIPLLLKALDRKEIRQLPPLPTEPTSNPTWIRLTSAISADPADLLNAQRVRVLRELLPLRSQFAQWWAAKMVSAIGGSAERAWLALGAGCEAAAGVALDLHGVNLEGEGAELVLNTGLLPPSGRDLERALMQAVLDGRCPGVTSIRSLPAQVAVALTPNAFLTTSDSGFTGTSETEARRRQDAVAALTRSRSPFGHIAGRRRFRAGEKGSTFPWANTASALFDHTGRCWLASEIAIIGAASPHRTAHTVRPGTTAFGRRAHPETLLAQSRTDANNVEWWRQQIAVLHDDLARQEWVLALWAVGGSKTITALFPEAERMLVALPSSRQQAVLSAATRLAEWGWLGSRPVSLTPSTPVGVQLLASRASRLPISFEGIPSPVRPQRGTPASSAASLRSIAKAQRWFLVDRTPTYN
jgi:hypothetical protein